MEHSEIQRHSFEEAKLKLQEFSQTLPSDIAFATVEVDGGLFGWGNHKVTGTELNSFIGDVQEKLISVNSCLCAITREFGEVYTTFDILDKVYISGILGSIENANAAIQQAMTANAETENTVERLRKTVIELSSLKGAVARIDSQVEDLRRTAEQFIRLSGEVNRVSKQVSLLTNKLEQYDDINRDFETYATLKEITSRKMKIAYAVGGIALVLSIASFILQLAGII